MKKFFRFTNLGILVIISLLVRCGTKKADNASTSEKPQSISLSVDGTWLAADNGEDIPEKGYEALTGIDLVINHPPHNEYPQILDLALTTGEITDVFVLTPDQYVRYATGGALYDMTEMYEKSKMKDKMVSQDFVDALRINGKLYAIPSGRGNGTLTFVRGDWMEKLGLKPPKDYKEFIEMLRAFKNKNPDGLKPNEVIPITAAGLANKDYPMDIYLREFYKNATPDYVKREGTWVDGMLEPRMKEALTRMRDAYAEGLIDREIITNQTSTCRNKFYSGVVGAFNYWAGYWQVRLLDNITLNVPHAKVVSIPAIKESYYVEKTPGIVAMSANVENPQGVFNYFFEVFNDAGEGQTIFTFGVEGKSYKVVDGVKEFLPTILNPDIPFNKVWIDPSLVVTKFTPKFIKQPFIDESFEMFRADAVQYQLPSASEEFGTLKAEIVAIKKNIIAKIVFGDFTVDEGIKKYEGEIKKYNDVVLSDMNK